MYRSANNSRTVGILYGGEMGSAVASTLLANGVRVVSTLGGRSAHTARRTDEAGMDVLPSLEDVVRTSDVVLSIVSPRAASDMAAQYAQFASVAPQKAIYVDVNSVRPELSREMARTIERAGRIFVDAAINGLAKNLTTSATLFLSGARAYEIVTLFADSVRTRVLGTDIGQAKAMKMLLAGMSKGVCALFAELGLLAERQGMLDEFIAANTEIYPGIAALVDRMLPTYAQHAGRRATEMSELEQTVRGSGLEPCLIAAIRALHEKMTNVSFDMSVGVGGGSVASLIRQLSSNDCLAGNAGENANV